MIGFFAGSFDPVTCGHLDLIERASALMTVVVGIGHNPNKSGLFAPAVRRELIIDAMKARGLDVQVHLFQGLVVQAARLHGADVLLRGVRSADDMGLEMRNGHGNRDLSGLETMLLLTSPQFAHVSSSLVREIHRFDGDVSRYVPKNVLTALAKKTS